MRVKCTTCNKETAYTADVKVEKRGRTISVFINDHGTSGGIDAELSYGCAAKLAMDLLEVLGEE